VANHPHPPPPRSGHPKTTPRRRVINSAISRVAAGIQKNQPTLNAADARKYAAIILSRPNVTLGKGGNIFWNGKRYNASQFAGSALAQRATGLTAQTSNEAALTGSPAYLQAVAELGLQRDQATAGLDDQQHQSLIQFGDPTFAGSDAATASAAAANPYSTTRLMGTANTNQQNSIRQQANRFGTYYGGGLQSGLDQQQLAYGGQTQDATTKLQSLLTSINTQKALANQAYNVGLAGAKTDAYNQMLASGYTAASQPQWKPGNYAVKGFGTGGRQIVGRGAQGNPFYSVAAYQAVHNGNMPGFHPIVPGPPPRQQPRV
jgi:hypothetical protein